MQERTRTESNRACRSCGQQNVLKVIRHPDRKKARYDWIECMNCKDHGPYALPGKPIPKANLANQIIEAAKALAPFKERFA